MNKLGIRQLELEELEEGKQALCSQLHLVRLVPAPTLLHCLVVSVHVFIVHVRVHVHVHVYVNAALRPTADPARRAGEGEVYGGLVDVAGD